MGGGLRGHWAAWRLFQEFYNAKVGPAALCSLGCRPESECALSSPRVVSTRAAHLCTSSPVPSLCQWRMGCHPGRSAGMLGAQVT